MPTRPDQGGFLAFVKNRIGFKTLGLIASALLIGFAVFVLVKELRGVHWDQVWTFMTGMKKRALIYAFVFAACAYLTLTAYDFFAVRTIGRSDIRYPTCATAAFTSYSIAHNLGATVFTGTVVRYLIYARRGLSAVDVVKVSAICGLTFWLGNLTVLGLGFTFEPGAIEAILPTTGKLSFLLGKTRIIGILMLVALAAYVLFMSLGHRTLGKGAWAIDMPSAPSTLLQMLIGVIDLTFCAAIFYVLLNAIPGAPHHPFTLVGVVFIGSMLLGFASHAPGAAGAFEATLLIALLPLGYDKEGVIAAIILFRLYYFIVPFVLALLLMVMREFAFGGGMSNIKASMAVIKQAEAARHEAKDAH